MMQATRNKPSLRNRLSPYASTNDRIAVVKRSSIRPLPTSAFGKKTPKIISRSYRLTPRRVIRSNALCVTVEHVRTGQSQIIKASSLIVYLGFNDPLPQLFFQRLRNKELLLDNTRMPRMGAQRKLKRAGHMISPAHDNADARFSKSGKQRSRDDNLSVFDDNHPDVIKRNRHFGMRAAKNKRAVLYMHFCRTLNAYSSLSHQCLTS